MVYTGRRVRRGTHLRPSLAYLSAILVERLRFRSSASVLTAQSGVLPNRRCSDMPTRRWPEVFTGSESYLHASSRLVQCKSVRARCGPCGELVHTPCVAHSKMVHMVKGHSRRPHRAPQPLVGWLVQEGGRYFFIAYSRSSRGG